MSGVWHESTVDRPFIRCIVSRGAFRSMDCALNRNMAGALSDFEE